MKPIKFNDFVKEVGLRRKDFDSAINRVLSSGWYILGKEVKSFENEFAGYQGVKHCLGVGNGLEALQISLMALGVGSGDEVITTPLSAVATTLAILAVGAKPIFVDVDKNGLIDSSLVEAAITPKTKVILPVHLYGNSVDIKKIRSICIKHGLYLLEDACQAHGSEFKGRKLGTFGEINCFSFYPTKNLGAFGDGGAIVTKNNKLAKICREIRDYGQIKQYKHLRYGLNSRLDEIQAGILRVKLNHLDEDNQRRRILASRYIENLSNLKFIEIIKPGDTNEGNFHLFVIKSKKRDTLQKFLAQYHIPTLIHYPKTIPDQPFLKSQYNKVNIPNARNFVKQILSLPCHPQMTLKQIDYISRKIIDFGDN